MIDVFGGLNRGINEPQASTVKVMARSPVIVMLVPSGRATDNKQEVYSALDLISSIIGGLSSVKT